MDRHLTGITDSLKIHSLLSVFSESNPFIHLQTDMEVEVVLDALMVS